MNSCKKWQIIVYDNVPYIILIISIEHYEHCCLICFRSHDIRKRERESSHFLLIFYQNTYNCSIKLWCKYGCVRETLIVASDRSSFIDRNLHYLSSRLLSSLVVEVFACHDKNLGLILHRYSEW